MPLAIDPDWQPLLPYALGGAALLMLLFGLPVVGRLLRGLFSFAMLALCLFLLLQHAPFDPRLARVGDALGLDRQEVTGDEVRIRMGADGHFWARARINGTERRMLVDSGATVTALSPATASAAGVRLEEGLVPVLLRTANGTASARTGTVDRLDLGGIAARDLKVVSAPGLGAVDVLGMNFLSRLAGWRVEGRTLILTPEARGGG